MARVPLREQLRARRMRTYATCAPTVTCRGRMGETSMRGWGGSAAGHRGQLQGGYLARSTAASLGVLRIA